MTSKYIRLALFFFLFSTLSSCTFGNRTQSIFEDYRERLHRIFDQEFIPVFTPLEVSVLKLPEVISVREETRIKLNEFYRLPECGVKPLIAERNTSLGKLAAPSQQLIYEIRLIQLLSQCMENDVLTAESKTTIQEILNVKRSEVLSTWQRVLLNSKEIDRAISSSGASFDEQDDYAVSLQAWQFLAWLDERLKTNQFIEEQKLAQLEQQLFGLEQEKMISGMIQSINTLSGYLQQMTTSLHLNQELFSCETAKKEQQIEYAKNVMTMFFIEKLQVNASAINTRYFQVAPSLKALFPAVALDEDSDKAFINEFDAKFEELKRAMREHAKAWQMIVNAC